MLASADTATQLVKLAKAETVGVFDYHKRRIRHIDADFYDRCRDENVNAASNEGLHDLCLFLGLELSVHTCDLEVGEVALKLGGVLLRRLQVRRELLVFLYHRADDKHLPPFGN